MKRRVEQVVVVGADAPAWMAAAAVEASFGGTGVRVRVIELPSQLSAVDVYSALPALAGFHQRLGLEEDWLFRICKSVPVAGRRFSNWSGGAPAFILGYDQPPPVARNDLGFAQFWVKGRKRGLRTEFENFSLGAMAAKVSRVPLPNPQAELHAGFGYHLNAGAYSALLKHVATRGGVEAKAAEISIVEIEADHIAAVLLTDGERVEADLFIDASGPQGLLIGRMPGTEFESWRDWLPCNRMLAASGKALRPLPGFSQISAFGQGWVGLFPLQDRTAVIAAYDSREIADEELLENLPILANLPITGDAVASRLASGVRKRAWVGNCVSIGESAFSLEPLDAVQLHSAHFCISQMMALFPVEVGTFHEAGVYDTIVRRAAINLRDFQAAHYKLNRRFDETLWDRCRDVPAPETLQRKLQLFAAGGRIPLFDDETFEEQDWEGLFIGHGLIPESYEPRVDAVPEQEHIARMQERLEKIAKLVGAMPSVDEFLSNSARQDQAEVTQ